MLKVLYSCVFKQYFLYKQKCLYNSHFGSVNASWKGILNNAYMSCTTVTAIPKQNCTATNIINKSLESRHMFPQQFTFQIIRISLALRIKSQSKVFLYTLLKHSIITAFPQEENHFCVKIKS